MNPNSQRVTDSDPALSGERFAELSTEELVSMAHELTHDGVDQRLAAMNMSADQLQDALGERLDVMKQNDVRYRETMGARLSVLLMLTRGFDELIDGMVEQLGDDE